MKGYKFRDGIQAIVYRKVGTKQKFLILHRIKNWIGWEFPKGGIKPGEKHKDALIRELKEECGINKNDINAILSIDSILHFEYPKRMWNASGFKGVSYKNFLVEIDSKTKCTIRKNDEPEHDCFKWISETEAKAYLDQKLVKSINESKKVLKKATISYSKSNQK